MVSRSVKFGFNPLELEVAFRELDSALQHRFAHAADKLRGGLPGGARSGVFSITLKASWRT